MGRGEALWAGGGGRGYTVDVCERKGWSWWWCVCGWVGECLCVSETAAEHLRAAEGPCVLDAV